VIEDVAGVEQTRELVVGRSGHERHVRVSAVRDGVVQSAGHDGPVGVRAGQQPVWQHLVHVAEDVRRRRCGTKSVTSTTSSRANARPSYQGLAGDPEMKPPPWIHTTTGSAASGSSSASSRVRKFGVGARDLSWDRKDCRSDSWCTRPADGDVVEHRSPVDPAGDGVDGHGVDGHGVDGGVLGAFREGVLRAAQLRRVVQVVPRSPDRAKAFDPTTFTKNRKRLPDAEIADRFFEAVVRRAKLRR